MNIKEKNNEDLLKTLITAIEDLKSCFQYSNGLEQKTMHRTAEEIRVELSEINLNLEKIVQNLEQLY